MIYVAVMLNIAASALAPKEKSVYESASAYALLSALYEKIYQSKIPEIQKDPNGKPHFKDGKTAKCPKFNISHTDGAYLAAIDTSGSLIGVDIQADISEEKEIRIAKRFPFINSVKPGKHLDDTVFLWGERIKDSISFSAFDPQIDENHDSFCSKWALTEAILKAEGGGFRSASRIQSIKDYGSFSFSINKNNKFFVSVVSLT